MQAPIDDTPFCSDDECAALAWIEAVIRLIRGYVPDEVHKQLRRQFTETEPVDLTMAVINIYR